MLSIKKIIGTAIVLFALIALGAVVSVFFLHLFAVIAVFIAVIAIRGWFNEEWKAG